MKNQDLLLSVPMEYVAATEQSSQEKPGNRLSLWRKAIRPRTLTIAVTPVIVGTVLAGMDVVQIAWDAFLVALVVSILIQIGTNLYNDVADFERGGDQPERIGPLRVTAAGWISAKEIKKAAMYCFLLAIFGGVYLVWLSGWPILVLGVLSLIAGFYYSGGSRPIAYTPLGEIFVFLFFGLGAVAGSYFLQTDSVSISAILAGAILGLQAAAVLMVNNYRDQQADSAVGRRTLTICVGMGLSRLIYAFLMVAPFLLLHPLQHLLPESGHLWAPLLAAPVAGYLIVCFWHDSPGPGFNSLLGRTAQMQALFAFLLCIGIYA